MNCGKANKAGLVNHLYSPDLMPTINSDDYWYLFSLRNERIAPFIQFTDVNKKDNFNANHFSFQQQNSQPQDDVSNTKESPFHLHENSLLKDRNAAQMAIQIIAANQPITNSALCRYLKERNINKTLLTSIAVKHDLKSKITTKNFLRSDLKYCRWI